VFDIWTQSYVAKAMEGTDSGGTVSVEDMQQILTIMQSHLAAFHPDRGWPSIDADIEDLVD
jgi:hypothetical protein